MKLNWRQASLSGIIMATESCWLYALLFLLNEKIADGRLSIIGLWLLYPLAFICNRLLQRLRWSSIYLYAFNGVALLIGILLVVKIQLYRGLELSDSVWLLALPRALAQVFSTMEPEVLILIGGVILWWLGWRLSRIRVTFAASVAEFQLGLTILLIVCFVASKLEVQLANTILVALAFFLFALLGMAFAHTQDGARWSIKFHRGFWTWLLLASIGLILVLGLFISSVVTADLVQLILLSFKWMWSMVLKVMDFLASIIPVSWLMKEMPPHTSELGEIPAEQYPRLFGIPEWLLRYSRIGWNVLFFGLILVVLWRVSTQFLGWLRRRWMTTAGAEVESLDGALKKDIISFLKRIMFRLLGLKLSFWRRRKVERLLPEIASVRQIYYQLLQWVAACGRPRVAFQTPYEYLFTLEGLLPTSKDALRFITQQYVSARYGLSSPTEAELHQLRQSWHQVRRNRLEVPGGEPARYQEVSGNG